MILPGLQVEKKIQIIIVAKSSELSLPTKSTLSTNWTISFYCSIESGLWFSFEKNLYPGTRLFWTLLNHRTLHEVACIACSWPAAFTQAVEPSRSCRKLGPQRELVFLLFNNLEISAHTLNVGLTPGSNKNYDQGSRLIWTIFSQCPPRNLLLTFVYSKYRLK